jgi:hypothetical protein
LTQDVGIAAGHTRRPHVHFARQIRDCLHAHGVIMTVGKIRRSIAKSRWHARQDPRFVHPGAMRGNLILEGGDFLIVLDVRS